MNLKTSVWAQEVFILKQTNKKHLFLCSAHQQGLPRNDNQTSGNALPQHTERVVVSNTIFY